MSTMDRSVLIIQRVLPEYRVKFFSELDAMLSRNNIRLTVIYGQEYPGTVPKTKNVDCSWAVKITNTYINLPKFRLVWQPAIFQVLRADLIIVEQSNALLINYIILALRIFFKKKVAFWGHGKNMQSQNKYSPSEFLKRRLIGFVDWWFAYTEYTVRLLIKAGFPEQKITNVQNSIDTDGFKVALDKVGDNKISQIKIELGIDSDNVLLYCGGMYADKHIEFLLLACIELQKRVNNLHVIFIGSGPEQYKVEQAASEYSFLHYVGPKFGSDRAVYFKISKALLMPGLVGLSIIDSFVAGVPIITTDIPIHSPEIYYLINNVNGLMTKHKLVDYVDNIEGYLSSLDLQNQLNIGCVESAIKYTLDNMVTNFYTGISKCL